MNKAGFLRRAVIVYGLGWLFVHQFLSDSRTIASAEMRHIGNVGIVVIAVWGIVTLLASRARGK